MAAIWNRVIAETTITFTTDPKSVTALRAAMTAPGALFFVAECGGGLAGFATASPFRGGPGYTQSLEHSIQLAPAFRGRGIGRALMAALEEAARRNGAHLLIAAISGENPGAVAFHSALGFAEVGRLPEIGRKFGRRIDLVLMQKFLDFPQ